MPRSGALADRPSDDGIRVRPRCFSGRLRRCSCHRFRLAAGQHRAEHARPGWQAPGQEGFADTMSPGTRSARPTRRRFRSRHQERLKVSARSRFKRTCWPGSRRLTEMPAPCQTQLLRPSRTPRARASDCPGLIGWADGISQCGVDALVLPDQPEFGLRSRGCCTGECRGASRCSQ